MSDDPSTPGDLTGQVALVTGGGRGLGRAFAIELAKTGVRVAVTGRTAEPLAETVELIERAGGQALAVPSDVSEPEAVAHVVRTAESQLGLVDILVNNAGTVGALGYDWEVDPEEWWHTFEVNVRGPFLYARAVLPGMVKRQRGTDHQRLHRRRVQSTSTDGCLLRNESSIDAMDEVPGCGHTGTWSGGIRAPSGVRPHAHGGLSHLPRRPECGPGLV